jgi:hypothetical protein
MILGYLLGVAYTECMQKKEEEEEEEENQSLLKPR